MVDNQDIYIFEEIYLLASVLVLLSGVRNPAHTHDVGTASRGYKQTQRAPKIGVFIERIKAFFVIKLDFAVNKMRCA